MTKIQGAAIGVALAFCAVAATANEFPQRPVRIVVAFPAGGAADTSMRIVAEKLSEKWQQPVVIDNRPGAAGAIGTEVVVRSAPDGYTALLNVSTLLVNEVTKPPKAFRMFRDLRPVTTLFTTPVLFVAGPNVKGSSLKAVLQESKTSSTPFGYGHHGEGTSTHLMGERLNKIAAANMIAVGYAGDAPMSVHILGGHLAAGFSSATNAKKLLESGKVKLLAQSFRKRSPLFPDVPTFKELGYEEMDRGTWGRIFLPAGTPEAIAVKFANDVGAVLATKEVREKFDSFGLVPGGANPTETLKELQSDYAYWQMRMREAGK
ncbi:MAG: tripartite tricarboxylate transporter substrate binding protein [Devosia sp.]